MNRATNVEALLILWRNRAEVEYANHAYGISDAWFLAASELEDLMNLCREKIEAAFDNEL